MTQITSSNEALAERWGELRQPRRREEALGFTGDALAVCFSENEVMSYEQVLQVIEGNSTGAVRASIGMVSTFADVYAYVQFAKRFVDRPTIAG